MSTKAYCTYTVLLSFALIGALISCGEESTGPEKINPYSYVIDAVIQEINIARTDPNKYATLLEEAKKNFDGMIYNDPYGKSIETKEGVAAFDEAIEYLKASLAMAPLNEVSGISRAA